MKTYRLFTATAFAVAIMAGPVSADLASDLNRMPAAEALARAINAQEASVEALVAEAAGKLKDNPKLLQALVSEAIKAFPQQAPNIVYSAVTQAPGQKTLITRAAISQLQNNPVAQQAVQQAANTAELQIARMEKGGGDTPVTLETEAEQTELAPDQGLQNTPPADSGSTLAPPPPPPPATKPPADKPKSVSPN